MTRICLYWKSNSSTAISIAITSCRSGCGMDCAKRRPRALISPAPSVTNFPPRASRRSARSSGILAVRLGGFPLPLGLALGGFLGAAFGLFSVFGGLGAFALHAVLPVIRLLRRHDGLPCGRQ